MLAFYHPKLKKFHVILQNQLMVDVLLVNKMAQLATMVKADPPSHVPEFNYNYHTNTVRSVLGELNWHNVHSEISVVKALTRSIH